jgi:hypothetical protein
MAQPLSPSEAQALAAQLSGMPTRAFDPDGKPRVPASGAADVGADPYPTPERSIDVSGDPVTMYLRHAYFNPSGAAFDAVARLGAALSATGDAMGPTGMPLSALGRVGSGVGRWLRYSGDMPELAATRTREALARELANTQQQAAAARHSEIMSTAQNAPPALTYQSYAAIKRENPGMIPAGNGGRIAPEADPWAPARMARESEAIERGRRSMQQQDLINRGAQISPEDAVSGTADRLLGVVRERMGAAANTAPEVPAGAYERLLANEPGVKMLLQNYGMTFDDLAGIMANRGYAVPPNATFNASVLQPRNSGLFGGMNADEKALRDALQRRNARPIGTGQGNVF